MIPRSTLLLLTLGLTSAFAAEKQNSGGFGTAHPTESKRPPAVRTMDDAKLLELRRAAKCGKFTEQNGTQKGWDLNDNSEFISFDGTATLVPKHSIIHVPEKLRSHVTSSMQGKFMPWQEFAARHRGIVTTFEVTIDEASGKTPLKPERAEALQKLDRIAIAILNGSPISFSAAKPATP